MSDDAKNPPSSPESPGSDAKAGAALPLSQKDSPELAAAKEKLKALQDASARGGTTGTTATGTAITGKSQWTPELATKMGAGIFAFSILLFAMISILVWKNKSVDSLLRTFGILLIIVASVFLVIVGYSDQQIAPVMGLMGTIAGYLLSRRNEPAPGAEAAVPKNPTVPKPDDSSAEPPQP